MCKIYYICVKYVKKKNSIIYFKMKNEKKKLKFLLKLFIYYYFRQKSIIKRGKNGSKNKNEQN